MRVLNDPSNHSLWLTLLLIGHVRAQIVSHELRKLAIASNQFGIDALRALDRIEQPDKVIVFSPVCLAASLSMVMMGSSKYHVVSSLRHALYVWSMKPQDINKAYRDVFNHIGMNQPSTRHHSPKPLNRRGRYLSLPKLVKAKEASERQDSWWSKQSGAKESRDQTSEPAEFSQINSISGIYIQRGLQMNYNYNLLLRDYYRTVVHPVDFIHNAEETRQHINSLVASSTEGKVKDLMKRTSLEGKQPPKALVISTFHFRGTLDLQMKTVKQQVSSNNIRKKRSKDTLYIQTDPTLLKYGVFKRGLDCTCVEIPFSNRLISLIIIMPNHANSTDLLLTKLSAQTLSDLQNSLNVRQLSLEIPVIKFGRGPTNVTGLLDELSLKDNFFGSTGAFNTETGLNRWLRAEDIVHETSIDIGTSVPPEDRLKVGAHSEVGKKADGELQQLRLDRPFLYFISDSINGLMLTMGRIR